MRCVGGLDLSKSTAAIMASILANMRSAWLCSRNDVLANVGILRMLTLARGVCALPDSLLDVLMLGCGSLDLASVVGSCRRLLSVGNPEARRMPRGAVVLCGAAPCRSPSTPAEKPSSGAPGIARAAFLFQTGWDGG